MNDVVLFIFEGRTTEQNIAENLCRFFINDGDKRLLRASYGFNIYQLFQGLRDDPGLDLFELVREEIQKRENRSANDEAVINIEDSESISDIYLFFDYDCHCSNADDAKLLAMLSRFTDSQEDGLLCISYPMVEAIRHQENEQYSYLLQSTNNLTYYKDWLKLQRREGNISADYFNWGLYTLAAWNEIIAVNLARANQLTQDNPVIPDMPTEQLNIFSCQLAKHIPNDEVAVLSSFPLMLHEFYGDRLFEKLAPD